MQSRVKSTLLTWGLGILLVLTLAVPLSGAAQSTGDEQGTPTDMTNTQAEEPTATEVPPTETPTPEPVATDTPTPEPIATEVPPTETPTVVPATDTPAPALTAMATSTLTATNIPSPTATATPSPTATKTTKTLNTSLAAAAATETCILISGNSNSIPLSQYVTYQCSSTNPPLKIQISAATLGWQWFYSWGSQVVPGSTDWLNGSFSPNDASGKLTTIYIYLSPTSNVVPGASGNVIFNFLQPSGNGVSSSYTLSGTRALTGANFALACSPISVTVATSLTGTSNCTLSSVGMASGVAVTVNSVSVAAPTGWLITPSPSGSSFTTPSTFTFTLTLTPSCAAATSAPTPNVTINSVISATALGSNVAGPSTTITAIHSATSNVSASITGSAITWSRPYSFSSQNVSGSVNIQVSASTGCAGWNVQMSASNFSYTGSAGGSVIANGNASVAPQPPTLGSGSLSGVSAGSGGALSSVQKVASASAGNGLGTYNQTLNVGVTIPGGARVGTYTSTITITAAAGP